MDADSSPDVPGMFDAVEKSTGPYFMSRPVPELPSVPQTWEAYRQNQPSFEGWDPQHTGSENADKVAQLNLEKHLEAFASSGESEEDGENSQYEILISEAESDFESPVLLDDGASAKGGLGEQTQPRGRGGKRGRPRGRRRGEKGRSVRALHNESKRQRKTGAAGKRNGAPRGHRKPIDPSPEFKRLHSQAMTAFIEGNYDLAEDLASQAILDNPEIFTAHSLLSEIHMAQGDKQRALTALFHGAHTRPRDQETWSKVAELMLELAGDDRTSSLDDAIYCYNRVIGADSNNIDARYRRAALNYEAGKMNKAAYDYLKLLEILPNDVTVLRHLAETFIARKNSAQAIRYYDKAIAYYKEMEPYHVAGFSWSDTNIYAELFLFSKKSEEGLARVKQVSRWLLGRGSEGYWDAYQDDDREFDGPSYPRRQIVPEFVDHQFSLDAYGEGLPMELRIKLAIFRLQLGDNHFEEAMRHFLWLAPENIEDDAKLHDYPDLFRETADVLCVYEHYMEALRFYEPLQNVEGYPNAQYYKAIALCYRHLNRYDKAEFCYRAMMEFDDEDDVEADEELAAMFVHAGLPDRAKPYFEEITEKRRRRRTRKQILGPKEHDAPNADPDAPFTSIEPHDLDAEEDAQFKFFRKTPKTKPERQSKLSKRPPGFLEEKNLQPTFENMRKLMEASRAGDTDARAEWMLDAKHAIDHFGRAKVFFPYDKHIKFLGYSNKAKARAFRPKAAKDALEKRIATEGGLSESDDDEIPTEFCNVSFEDWFECFMEYALLLAKDGDHDSAYTIARLASDVNVFYHDKDRMFTIHVIWSMCAVIGQDHQTLCTVARYFMKEFQFVTDSYRLFAALNRTCNHRNRWYNNGPTQKFVLRQVKAVDFSLVDDEGSKKSLFDERAAYLRKDENGNDIKAEEMDVALIMLYGHILYYGESYLYSLNYFYRALALDPDNPMINLSLALGYIHHALKRQADNRQYLIMQGLSFLFKYHDERLKSENPSERQEAYFNVAKTFHMLGLLHLAIPYYEDSLELSVTIQKAADGGDYMEDFAREAAFALRSIYAVNGNIELARGITEKWLKL